MRWAASKSTTWSAGPWGSSRRQGPATEQDRWEEDTGINAFTLAVCVSALVCGAAFLDEPARTFALQLADDWNARIEDWTSVRGTRLARSLGVEGYYIRIAPPPSQSGDRSLKRILPIKNRARDPVCPRKSRFRPTSCNWSDWGCATRTIRWSSDSVKVIDSQLGTQTPAGPAWHRYTGDGYGEQADGSAFNGAGQVGRGRC